MRRNILVALVAVGALCLGVIAIMLYQSRRARKPDPATRLNLEEDERNTAE